ncbi:MFS transporter [Sporomusa malonica]|nr:MFS transporter [Sporomusa malonica]
MQNNATASRYRWIILLLCVSCFLFSFITRFTWPPLISVIVPDLGMNMGQAGAFMSAFYLGYVLTQIPAGLLADRFGVRIILSVCLIIEGVATSSFSLIDNYELGFNLRVLAGLGSGAVFSSCSRALVEWFPAKEQGLAFGILTAAPSSGILITNILVPYLNTMFGWRGAFQSVGLLTIIAGVLVFFLMRFKDQPDEKSENITAGLKYILDNKNFKLISAAGFFLMWLQLGTATWANVYIKGLGFSVSEAGRVMAYYGLGGAIAPLISGVVSDMLGCRKWLVITAFILVVPLTILFGYQTSLAMLCVVGFASGFSSYLANPQLTVLISQTAGIKRAATANGVANCLFQMASLLSPWFIGKVIDLTGNFSFVWWILAAGPVMATFFMLRVYEESIQGIKKSGVALETDCSLKR